MINNSMMDAFVKQKNSAKTFRELNNGGLFGTLLEPFCKLE